MSAQIVLLITRTDTIAGLKSSGQGANILLVILFTTISAIRTLLQVLPLDTASAAATEWRAQGEVDVLLRIQTDNEAGDVHQLLTDTANAQQKVHNKITNDYGNLDQGKDRVKFAHRAESVYPELDIRRGVLQATTPVAFEKNFSRLPMCTD